MEVTLQTRIIRAGQAPAYCGMGRDIFAKEIRPFEMVKVVSRDSNPRTQWTATVSRVIAVAYAIVGGLDRAVKG